MATLFEIVVAGAPDELENLAAAGEAALDEIERVARLLSRFDAASETARLNRDAARGPVLVDYEMLAILQTCRAAWQRTGGHFDLTASSAMSEDAPNFGAVRIDAAARTVQFDDPRLRLDFGAFGKGYALDRAGALLREYGAGHALLHGGTSSVLALGDGPDGEPWRVGVRDPWASDMVAEVAQIGLRDRALSSSAVLGSQEVSDIVQPHAHVALTEQAACVVLADTAAEAEILSTALLCMGRAAATLHCQQHAPGHAGWIEQASGQTVLRWLTAPHPGLSCL